MEYLKGLTEEEEQQIERLVAADINLAVGQAKEYIKGKDSLGKLPENAEIPLGYKRCGKCREVKKFYLFNRNKGSKTNTTGNCKSCQKASASVSYEKTKKKRNYKKYYAENKEKKQEHARNYYQNNKERSTEIHKKYLATKAGKKVMKRAHMKRQSAMSANAGIPWKREWVLDRDKIDGKVTICYLCGKPIEDTSGTGCHIDHVVSIVNGGLDCFTNVASTHSTCNLTKEKDDRNLSADSVMEIQQRAEKYIDLHPELFAGE